MPQVRINAAMAFAHAAGAYDSQSKTIHRKCK